MTARQYLGLSLACILAGCAGDAADSGLDQPLWVVGGTYVAGRLPGSAPRKASDTPAIDKDDARSITSLETNDVVVHPGQSGKRISGRASDDGYAIALRFEGLGDGYWVKPLGESDVLYPGELSFRVDLELAGDLPLGKHALLFSVIDAKGRAGRQQALPLCVTSRFDRALHACDQTQAPPAASITLSWESAADLDLIVQTESGELVDARHPGATGDEGDEGGETAADGDAAGILYADAHVGCGRNAAQREDLVWQELAPSGRHRVYVNLFDACGEPASYFEVSAYASRELEDGGYRFRKIRGPVLGELLASDANGGKGQGVFVTSVNFP